MADEADSQRTGHERCHVLWSGLSNKCFLHREALKGFKEHKACVSQRSFCLLERMDLTERRHKTKKTSDKDNEFCLIKTKGLGQANRIEVGERGQVPELAET